MDVPEYDEFGNYIGEDSDQEDDRRNNVIMDRGRGDFAEDDDIPAVDQHLLQANAMDIDMDSGALDNQIVLHEDKKYYPSALEVFGPGG